MRTKFVSTAIESMRKNPDIFFITADMGYGALEELAEEFSDRFLNVGVSEANAVGIAAGLALSGYRVIFYAQASFATMRCFEQVRLDIASNNLDVKIVGTSAGFTLCQYGISHFSMEDIGLMRLLPNMRIFSPGDVCEAELVTKYALKNKGPFYIRIGRTNSGPDIKVHLKQQLNINKLIKIKDGKDVALITSGSMMITSLNVREALEKKKISTALFSVPAIKPIDGRGVRSLSNKFGLIVSIEEHYITGGTGDAIRDVLDGNGKAKLLKLGNPDIFIHMTGSREYLLEKCGLSVNKITARIISSLKKR